jgi:hypothetical protein
MKHAVAVVALLAATASSFPAAAIGTSPLPPSSYPSCGFYWNKNTPPTAAQHRNNACLLRARREGRKARLVAARSTIEGDPIVMYVFVHGRMPVLVVTDTTRDKFGPREWSSMRCSRVTQAQGFLGLDACQAAGRGKPSWLKPVKLRR